MGVGSLGTRNVCQCVGRGYVCVSILCDVDSEPPQRVGPIQLSIYLSKIFYFFEVSTEN